MRLTLHTLLAYMDEVLSPEDREDLKRQIEQSEFAGELLHRARDTMRRLRLNAPPVSGPDVELDANTVAGYLDSTMPPEQEADFERVCLKSDMYLAEVASCHQILAMVLGQRAEINSDARARIYDVPSQLDLLEAQQDAAPQAPPVALSSIHLPPSEEDVHIQPSSNVPDYLRSSFMERHSGKVAVAAAILVISSVVFFWPSRPAPLPDEVAVNGGPELEAPNVNEGDTTDPDTTDGASSDSTSVDDDGELEEAPPFVPGDAGNGADPTPDPSGNQGGTGDQGDLVPSLPSELQNGATGNTTDSASNPPPLVQPIPVQPADGAGAGATASPAPLPTVPPPNPADSTAVGTNDQPQVNTPTDGGAESSNTDATTIARADAGDQPITADTTSDAPPPVPPPAANVATFDSPGTMVVRLDRRLDAWMRLAPLSQLNEQDHLVALPGPPPVFTLLRSNVKLQLHPQTRVILASDEGDALPDLGSTTPSVGLNVLYGRVVLFNPSPPEEVAIVRMRLGEKVYPVELAGGVRLAVDVQRYLPPGVDATKSHGELLVDIFVTSGKVRWSVDDNPVPVDAPAHLQVVGQDIGMVQPLPQPPSWIDQPTMSTSLQLAFNVVEPEITTDRPVRLTLDDLKENRRREVRSLVSTIGLHVGEFEPFVKALNDMYQSQTWDEHIDALREAMAMDTFVAENVRDAFRKYKGDAAGDELFRMLWGYSQQQLENGALEQLIRYLEHESLDFRVLAFHNLSRATGKKLEFTPHGLLQQRQRGAREWRERFLNGELQVDPQGTGRG